MYCYKIPLHVKIKLKKENIVDISSAKQIKLTI